MQGSTLYTMGTALRRALDSGLEVEVMVQGHWIAGTVVALDGHGLVLTAEQREHTVVRLEQVAAIRVVGAMPGAAHQGPSYAVPEDREELSA